MQRPFASALAALLLMSSAPALAQSLQWRVSETSGPVTIRHGAESRPAERGATLAEGDVVTTGRSGRAVLVHQRDFVTVAANSRVAVPEAAQATGLTKLMQTIGNAVYRIEKMGVPHFGVSTPYLAAVVKGTTFSVTVDATGSSLQVTEGAVEVATLDGGARDLIRPGAIARIEARDVYRLHVEGDQARTVDSPARTTGPTGNAPASDSTPAALPAVSAEPVATETGDVMEAPVALLEAVASKPSDLGAATGGMVTGTVSPVVLASVAADLPALVAEARQPPRPEPLPIAAPAPAASPPVVSQPAVDAEAALAAERARAEGERSAAEKAAADRVAAEKAQADRTAADKAQADRIAAEKATADRAEADKAAKDKVEAEKEAKDKAEADKAAKDKAEAEKEAKDKAEADKAAKDKAEAEKEAKDKAEADKAAKDKAEAEKEAKPGSAGRGGDDDGEGDDD